GGVDRSGAGEEGAEHAVVVDEAAGGELGSVEDKEIAVDFALVVRSHGEGLLSDQPGAGGGGGDVVVAVGQDAADVEGVGAGVGPAVDAEAVAQTGEGGHVVEAGEVGRAEAGVGRVVAVGAVASVGGHGD